MDGVLSSGRAEDELRHDGTSHAADNQRDVPGAEEGDEQSGEGTDSGANDAQHDAFGHFPSE